MSASRHRAGDVCSLETFFHASDVECPATSHDLVASVSEGSADSKSGDHVARLAALTVSIAETDGL